MVPNLEERVMTGSSEETKLVADLVSLLLLYLSHTNNLLFPDSCREVLQAPGLTIQKA